MTNGINIVYDESTWQFKAVVVDKDKALDFLLSCTPARQCGKSGMISDVLRQIFDTEVSNGNR